MAMNLGNADVAKLQAMAQAKALVRIREQAARGIERSFPQPRNAAIVAVAGVEVLVAMGLLQEEQRQDAEMVLRAALQAGPLMQGSTLQKMAVKEGIYEEAGNKLNENY